MEVHTVFAYKKSQGICPGSSVHLMINRNTECFLPIILSVVLHTIFSDISPKDVVCRFSIFPQVLEVAHKIFPFRLATKLLKPNSTHGILLMMVSFVESGAQVTLPNADCANNRLTYIYINILKMGYYPIFFSF